MPALDVDQLKTFLAIADSGNFTRAAEEVNKTQSAVSMQMKRLEETLGRPLFSRDGRASRMTPDGERLVEFARRMVTLNDEAIGAFTQPEITGTVRFGTPDDYADLFLPEILARFARTHPMVNVDVDCNQSQVLAGHIRNSELDLAVVTFNGGDIHGEPLMSAELVWVTSPRHQVHLAETLPFASASISCGWRKLAERKLEQHHRPYRVAYVSPNFSTICNVVVQGLAVAVMPRICVRPGMRILTEAEGFPPLGSFEIGLMTKPGRASPAAKALAQHIRDGLGANRKLLAAE
ncbi:MAG: LysR family transcriptional regulator [Alphaproteobacteria bacterium]|nr:LysR family transcriptional regulator [Alphaproteobacteria bacterium]